MQNLKVSNSRADELVQILVEAFSRSEGLLGEQEDLVENQIPPGIQKLSREHALFLFYTVQNDHGTKSAPMYERAKKLYHAKPAAFDPYRIATSYHIDDLSSIIEDIVKPIGARYPSSLAKSWIYNSNKLIAEYNGDPLNIFTSSDDATILIKKIKSFRGYGDKIGGMLLRAVVGIGFNKNVYGLENVLLPVDIHDSRIMFLTKIFEIPNLDCKIDYYKYVRRAQLELLNACNRCGTSWLNVDRALWLIGSRGCVTGRCIICPLRRMCKKNSRGSLLDD